jgi:DNA-binding transcriptional ArsR family regulator
MHALDVLGDPTRRRILELLSSGEELSAGEIVEVVQREQGISQPAVSQHLRILREQGFTSVRAEGTRRLYLVEAAPLRAADRWLERFRHFWDEKLDALGAEIERGKAARKRKR